jgi:AraC family transcriptional regulator of adaptative response/methylated-DNA-[protein]-cysteine methyltransferase
MKERDMLRQADVWEPVMMDIDEQWQSVVERDKEADGAFVFAVRSTGIYCRPSCPARRPERTNVLFFALPAAAEQAGFRACRRCRPGDVSLRDPQAELVQQICRHIEANLDESLTLERLGAEQHLSPHHLQRTFKRLMGITPRQYADARRLERVKAELRQGENVTAALYESGYSSSSRLYERAPGQLGMTPSAYRQGGRGAQIRYTVADSPLGRLLVAATEKGVCAVSLGDRDAELEAALHKEYPAAEVEQDATGLLKEWVTALLDYLEGERPNLDLPLDVQATAFQWRVWQALQQIPYGRTASYSEVARGLGRPTAARAVARACASNPVALVVPCHRVVRENGELGGYRWGLERKRKLLQQEKQ